MQVEPGVVSSSPSQLFMHEVRSFELELVVLVLDVGSAHPRSTADAPPQAAIASIEPAPNSAQSGGIRTRLAKQFPRATRVEAPHACKLHAHKLGPNPHSSLGPKPQS